MRGREICGIKNIEPNFNAEEIAWRKAVVHLKSKNNIKKEN